MQDASNKPIILCHMNRQKRAKYSSPAVQKKVKWRIPYRWRLRILEMFFRVKGNRGTYVVQEDWDNLIILDACRYDLFRMVTGIDVDYKISRGSSTPEFLMENFGRSRFLDIVYVSANPYVNRLVKDSFHKVLSVWKFGWDDELNTVRPETLVKYALEAENEYPDKRLIVHFMQPHIPFIKDLELNCCNFYERFKAIERNEHIPPIETPWKAALKGTLEISRVWKAYRRNLEAVIPYAFYLAKKLKGKTVITSDHGEAFKRLLFPIPITIVEHPSGIHIPELVKVPWMVFDSKERKKIRAEARSERKRMKKIIERLKTEGLRK